MLKLIVTANSNPKHFLAIVELRGVIFVFMVTPARKKGMLLLC